MFCIWLKIIVNIETFISDLIFILNILAAVALLYYLKVITAKDEVWQEEIDL